MLLQTSISPKLLEEVPADVFAQKLFCNLWLGLLFDLAESCVLILPTNHSSSRDYMLAVSNWPTKYQKRAQELVAILHQRHRFIPSPNPYSSTATCASNDCQSFVDVSLANLETFHFSTERCSGCPNISTLSYPSIEALEYFISDFSRRRRMDISRVLADGEWTRSDFEAKILKPVFATAKHVKIYDRYIGRTSLGANYKQTIEWIVSVFQSVGGGTRGGVFEIYSGIKNTPNASMRRRIKTEMQTFATQLQAATGVAVQIILKSESSSAQCPHGRYLVTDQVSVLIDRGFDLLWDDAKMFGVGLNPTVDPRPIRDVAVIMCNSCHSVDAQTRSLPAF